MSAKEIRNIPASVLARLLNLSQKTGDDYQVLLAKFASERFLYRLGRSTLRDRFVLKGAMLLRIWSANPGVATGRAEIVSTANPAVTEQRAIAEFLDRETTRIDTLVAKVREAIDHLKEYRTEIISAAVTGKIDVREEAA
jgi:hypothetical protein